MTMGGSVAYFTFVFWSFVYPMVGEESTLPEANRQFASETVGLESAGSDEFPFGFRPTDRCELLVGRGVSI